MTETESGAPPQSPDSAAAELILSEEAQFAVGFGGYEPGQRLWEADWTRIARWYPVENEHMPADWRALDADGSIEGRAAALLDLPRDPNHRLALRWDALPVLKPPVEILAHLWLPPGPNGSAAHPELGLSWFIQEPDETGRFNGFALVRNPWEPENFSFNVYRMSENVRTQRWFGILENGVASGGWTWIRMRHTVGATQGTIRYREWKGALEDEPSEWDAELSSTHFRPVEGETESTFAGKAGLVAMHNFGMEEVVPLWDVFSVGVGGAPAPPPSGASTSNLALECLPAEVERGEEIQCTASTDPGTANLTVREWSFSNANGLSASEASQASSWAGKLVVSGTVTVRADVDGLEQTATAQVEASPRRDWSEVPEFTVEEVSPGLLPPEPVNIGDFGQTRWEAITDDAVAAVAEVRSGPNQGLHYLTAIPYGVEAIVSVNTHALSVGSLFWQSQPPVQSTNAAGDRMCSRREVVPFAAVVRRHEGIGLAAGSHARFYRDKLFKVAGPSVEDIVAAQPFQVLSAAGRAFQSAMDAADLESDKADQGNNIPAYCLFTGIVY